MPLLEGLRSRPPNILFYASVGGGGVIYYKSGKGELRAWPPQQILFRSSGRIQLCSGGVQPPQPPRQFSPCPNSPLSPTYRPHPLALPGHYSLNRKANMIIEMLYFITSKKVCVNTGMTEVTENYLIWSWTPRKALDPPLGALGPPKGPLPPSGALGLPLGGLEPP